jgi:hypothetical protein
MGQQTDKTWTDSVQCSRRMHSERDDVPQLVDHLEHL